MQLFDLFNIKHPTLTVPNTIIIGLIFLTILFNMFKNQFLTKYKRAEESGFRKNIWHLAKWIKGKINYLVGVYFFSMTLLFSIMVFIFRDETFRVRFNGLYLMRRFISAGLNILFYTYRDINFDLKSYKQVRQEQKKREGGKYDFKRKRFSGLQTHSQSEQNIIKPG